MALNGLNCAYVPLRNYSLTHSLTQWAWLGLHDLFKKFCGPVVYHDLGMSDARYELKLLDDTELF